MRLILCNSHIELAELPDLPDETFVFLCFEDFSVGPLAEWKDPEKFQEERAEFWDNTPSLDLPDGSKMDYFVWLQILPRYDLVELHQKGVDLSMVPEPYEFDDLAHQASTIEVWGDFSARECIWRWYLSALLPRIGVDQNRVSFRFFPKGMRNKEGQDYWSDLLLNAESTRIPAVRLSPSEWCKMQRYWEAVVKLPNSPDPVDPECACSHIARFQCSRGTLSRFCDGPHKFADAVTESSQNRLGKNGACSW